MKSTAALALAFAVVAGSVAPADAATNAKPARFVHPFVGTAAQTQDFGTGGGAGNTFPAAALPFGMAQWGPDTVPGLVNAPGGYSYDDQRIKGFSLTHMSGAGCATYQDIPFMPTTAAVTQPPTTSRSATINSRYVATFSHRHESAAPGRYDVRLNPGTSRAIGVHLSATTRTGAAHLVFPRTRRANVLIDPGASAMGDGLAQLSIHPRRRLVTGQATSGRFCYQNGLYHVYFAAKFNRRFAAYGTWQQQQMRPATTHARDTSPYPIDYQPNPDGPPTLPENPSSGAHAGGWVSVNTRHRRAVDIRVGVSFTSLAEARRNLAAEQPRFDFSRVRRHAARVWNHALDRIRVRGGSRRETSMFETALYHALLSPRTFSDVSGTYPGMDGRVHRARHYTQYADYSGWDVYRTQIPLLALIEPHRVRDLVRSLLADQRQSGWLPKWSYADQQATIMTGDPADATIATAHAMGVRGFNTRAALRAMVKGATQYGIAENQYAERPGLKEYAALGYIPEEEDNQLGGAGQFVAPPSVWGPAATTLEYALDDFAINAFAHATCQRSAQSNAIGARANNWGRLYDPAAGYLEARSASGAFSPTAKATTGSGFVEGDAAQYTWFVPQDVAGLIDTLGGRRTTVRRLDAFFTKLNDGPTSPYAFLGNEPTLQTPYLYDWAGAPWRTQAVERRALLSLYSPTPDGLPGNDDLGTMSAAWVLGALGLYPAVPGTDVFTVSSPLFPHARMRVAHGVVRLDAAGARQHHYIRRLAVDGHAGSRPWLHAATLRHGARLHLRMQRFPDRRWGSRPGDAPPSGAAALPACRRDK